ncbi:hypothetical protein OG226_01160 [Streptomyces sp. NBC_01261]|uniref:Rv1733c family protein n=1 Tax=Streptomyces sp. NBC_01261 TaxID=2903802 RepID=UPI002E375088|nr:hypothetical protein [Streptomyces sp. NBC_01261]
MARAVLPGEPPHEDLARVLLWRWRRNPLRRRTDLVQAWVAAGLFLMVLAGIPTTIFLAGDTAYRHYEKSARHQIATRHPVPAVLVRDAPRHPEPGSDEAKKARYPVTVRFTDAQGRSRTAQAHVRPALPAGSTVRVWVNAAGEVTGPPLTPEQIRNHSMGWALVAALTVPLIGAAVYGVADRRLERHNLARWDTAWAETAPRWTTFP